MRRRIALLAAGAVLVAGFVLVIGCDKVTGGGTLNGYTCWGWTGVEQPVRCSIGFTAQPTDEPIDCPNPEHQGAKGKFQLVDHTTNAMLHVDIPETFLEDYATEETAEFYGADTGELGTLRTPEGTYDVDGLWLCVDRAQVLCICVWYANWTGARYWCGTVEGGTIKFHKDKEDE